MPNKTFVIGSLEGNFVALKVFGYETPQAGTSNEANWLSAELSVSAGAWSGRVREVRLTTAEIVHFRDDLIRLEKGEAVEIAFEPIEAHLVLKMHAEAGKIQVSGVSFDVQEGGNAIAFNWFIEPKQLKGLGKQIKAVEEEFPPW